MAVLLQPRIEAEVAFVLRDGLDRADLDLNVVRSAVDHAVAAHTSCGGTPSNSSACDGGSP